MARGKEELVLRRRWEHEKNTSAAFRHSLRRCGAGEAGRNAVFAPFWWLFRKNTPSVSKVSHNPGALLQVEPADGQAWMSLRMSEVSQPGSVQR